MKALVAFYTHTGTTRKVAEAIADCLHSDLEEIKETVSRKGIVGYLRAGRDAIFKVETSLIPIEKDPGDYHLVIVGTPVWGLSVCPAIRTYLVKYSERMKQLAFFIVSEGTGPDRIARQMEQIVGKKAKSYTGFIRKGVEDGSYLDKVGEFVRDL